jgi:hypothetical protein
MNSSAMRSVPPMMAVDVNKQTLIGIRASLKRNFRLEINQIEARASWCSKSVRPRLVLKSMQNN